MNRISSEKTASRPGLPAPGGENATPEGTPASAASSERQWALFVCILLAAMVWAVFGQTQGFDFVNYDDNLNVYDNPDITGGFSMQALSRAFTRSQVGHWDPLTTISHVLDSQFYGSWAGGHHLTNVLLHGIAAILLFLVLRGMTGALWRSAFVAAVFAIHPLRVESVAWVSERKDVLSGVFFMLIIASYARYARGPSPMRYLGTLLLFALGLMSKSMLVTLPFVLLLLDYWPLGRFSNLRRVLLEKIPFFLLSIALCVVQLFADRKGIISIEHMPLSWRAGNAVVSYAVYIGQIFYPANLAAFYPHPGSHLPAWEIACSLLLLASISATAFALRRTRPYLLVGWLWYLGMLVPVIGIVQSGVISRADRYTYLPQIGLYLMITWTVADLCARWRYRGIFAGFAATAALIPLALLAYTQTSYWRNSEILWSHAMASTPDNTVVHDNLGNVFLDNRQIDKAIEQSKKSLAIDGSDYLAHNNLGLDYIINGQVDAAIEQFEITLKIYPDYTIGHINLGGAFVQKQKFDEAIAQFSKALEADPDNAGVHYSLSHVLMLKGRVDEAIVHLRKVLDNQPHNATAHYNLGLALAQKGLVAEAVVQYQKALEDQPRYTQAENNLAWLLATSTQDPIRNGTEAVKLARQASRHSDDNDPTVLDTLAAAYAEAGRFSDAVKTAERALALAGKQGDKTLAANLRKELAFYQAGKPFRDDGK